VKILLLLPLLLGLMSPAIAHNENNSFDPVHDDGTHEQNKSDEEED
tara:strand:+ start:604 stop:741 length:138 start_codon:yes stop_codon:yes gene_type:complete